MMTPPSVKVVIIDDSCQIFKIAHEYFTRCTCQSVTSMDTLYRYQFTIKKVFSSIYYNP